MDGWAEGESDPFPFEFPGNVAGVRNGAGQAVQLRHDQRVALAQRRQRLGEAGSVPRSPPQCVDRRTPSRNRDPMAALTEAEAP